MILMLLFLGYRIFSWINNYLLVLSCCSSYKYICMCPARAYEPDVGFHAFSSLYNPSSLFSSSLSLVSFCLCNLTPFTLRRRSLSVFILLTFLALCIGLFLALGTSFRLPYDTRLLAFRAFFLLSFELVKNSKEATS